MCYPLRRWDRCIWSNTSKNDDDIFDFCASRQGMVGGIVTNYSTIGVCSCKAEQMTVVRLTQA